MEEVRDASHRDSVDTSSADGPGPQREIGPITLTPGAPTKPAPALRVPQWLDQTSAWAWRLLLLAGAILVFLWILSKIQIAVVPALIAVMIAATVRPLITRLEGWGFPTLLATLLPIVVTAGGSFGVLWFVGAQATAELRDNDLQTEEIRLEVEQWLMDGPLNLTQEQIAEGEENVRNALVGGARSFGSGQSGLVLQVSAGSILIVVLSFLLAKDGPQLWSRFVSRMNPTRQESIDCAGRAAAATMASYLRAVGLTGLTDAVLIGIGLAILDVPLLVPLVLLTFLSAFFPVVGATFSGFTAALVALVTLGPTTAIWVVVLTLAVQQLEGNVVMPMIMGRSIQVHPSLILLSLTAGGAVAGLPGAFLAVPVVTGTMAAIRAFGEAKGPASVASPVRVELS